MTDVNVGDIWHATREHTPPSPPNPHRPTVDDQDLTARHVAVSSALGSDVILEGRHTTTMTTTTSRVARSATKPRAARLFINNRQLVLQHAPPSD